MIDPNLWRYRFRKEFGKKPKIEWFIEKLIREKATRAKLRGYRQGYSDGLLLRDNNEQNTKQT